MSALPVVAWPLADWLSATSSAASSFYEWDDETRPRTVRVGRRRLVVESPEAWLQRMAVRELAQKQLRARKRRRTSTSTDTSEPSAIAAAARDTES